jgi:hypothetical protein
VQSIVKKEYFANQFSVIPRDGEKVNVGDLPLTWHAVETKLYNVNLYHFARALGKPTSNVLFWAVTIVNAPEEMPGVRLAIGSNAGSVWWVNGQEVIGIYGDRQTVIDDGVSKRLTLRKGPNVIRAAIVNGGGATDFCARLLDAQERPLRTFTVRVSDAPLASLGPQRRPPIAEHLTFTPDRAGGIYEIGETVGWTITAGPVKPEYSWKWTVRRNNAVVLKEGRLNLSSGKDRIEIRGEEPGMLYVAVEPYAPDGVRFAGGNTGRNYGLYAVAASVAPMRIGLSTPRPDDFDTFWNDKLSAQGRIPVNAVLTPVQTDVPGVELNMFVLDALGSRAHGYVAKPAREGKFPALIQLQYAGVYALNAQGAAQRAAEGWLFLNVDSHDKLPSDPSGGIPRNYQTIGNTDREKSYFPRHVSARLARCRLPADSSGLGRQDDRAHGRQHGRPAEPRSGGAAAGEDHGGACVRSCRRGHERRPARPQGRISQLALRQCRCYEDGAVLRSGQLRLSDQGSGDGGHRLHRYHFAACGNLDGAQPDSRSERTAPHDRIRAR